MKKSYTGINIQYPISELILSGEKTIETRTYPLPEKYLNKELLFVETPGREGKFKARTVALIKFTQCFEYKSEKDFYKDFKKHKVDKQSPWAWTPEKPKWGWELVLVKKLKPKALEKKNGIVFTTGLEI